jgi:Tol biopolymer transport system component
VGCEDNRTIGRGFADISLKTLSAAVSLSIPSGSYLDVAWLDENRLAFLYSPELSFKPQDYQVVIYAIDTEEWRRLSVFQSDECRSASIGQLQRLPNGKLGFVQQCHILPYGEQYTLYTWDTQADTIEVLQSYAMGFHAGSYAYAPDMSELIQHETVGTGLNDQMYRVTQDGQIQRLFPDWQRVAFPGWSSDGRTIAFMGTEAYPQKEPTSAGEIADLLFYPWDLYLMDANGENLRILLAEVKGGVHWQPHGRSLSFGGSYKDTEGVFIVDTDPVRVTRVWPRSAAHDWSPDGKQMVIIDRTRQDNIEVTHPVIADVSLDTK